MAPGGPNCNFSGPKIDYKEIIIKTKTAVIFECAVKSWFR